MLADMATELYAMKTMVYDAAWRLDQGDRDRTRAGMVKLFCTETIGRIADRAVQVLGGMGYMQEAPSRRSIARSAGCESTRAPRRSSASSSRGTS
jgi:alkylation response protein AidB-like acyl-CoA dehydrogenase